MRTGPPWLGLGLVAVIPILTVAVPALAEEVRLVNPEGPEVIVWKDRKARNEGLELMRTGAHRNRADALAALVACRVPVGTKASLVDTGAMISHDVEITSGEAAGCRGNVPAEFLQRTR